MKIFASSKNKDAFKVFKVRLSCLQTTVSNVDSDFRKFLFRDVEINTVGVGVLHVKLFCGKVLCFQNRQRGTSDITVHNNIATSVHPRPRHIIGKVHGWSFPKGNISNTRSIWLYHLWIVTMNSPWVLVRWS